MQDPAAHVFAAAYLGRHLMADQLQVAPPPLSLESWLANPRQTPTHVLVDREPLLDRARPRFGAAAAHHFDRAALRAAFADIGFSDSVRAAFAQAAAAPLPPATLALHLRAGDVVYGRLHQVVRYVDKVIPVELAEQIIKQARARGERVCLFGQDRALLAYLAQACDAVTADDLFAATETAAPSARLARDAFDIALMSRCRRLIGGQSGFAILAGLIGDAAFDDVGRIYAAAEIHRIILTHQDRPQSGLVSGLVSAAQRQAALIRILRDGGPEISDATIAALCRTALQEAPNHAVFRLVAAGLRYAGGDLSRAAALLPDIPPKGARALAQLIAPVTWGPSGYQRHILPIRAATEHCATARQFIARLDRAQSRPVPPGRDHASSTIW